MVKAEGFDISRLRFCLIDKDKNLRDMVASTLRTFYVEEIVNAADADEFEKALKNFRPDVIICEWELPVVNGIDLTRKIRRGEFDCDPLVSVIFLTAHTQMWQVTAARDAGITEFLAKPVSPKTLYKRICSVIEKPRAFIEADEYVGPDRRRQRDPYQVGKSRRSADAAAAAAGGDVEAAVAGMVSDDEIDRMLGL